MSERVYCLSPGLDVVIKGDAQWEDSIYTYFGDTPVREESMNKSSELLIELDSDINTNDMRVSVHPDLSYDSHSFYDSKYDAEYAVNGDDTHLKLNQFGVEWLKWSMQLANLRSDQYFIHSSAVEKDGDVIVFPSWGGVGKTTITSGLVKDLGFNLLGDDLNTITKDSVVYGFPKRMVIYPYHKSVFPEVFDSGDGPPIPNFLTNPLSRVYHYLRPVLRKYPRLYRYARKKNPQSARVAPSKIFGSERIARQGKLDTVVWLERVPDLNDVVIQKKSTRELISKIYGSSIVEFKQHCRELTNIAAGLNMIDAELLGNRWYNLLTQSLGDIRTVELQIPAELSGSKFTESVYDEMKNENII